MAAPQCGIAGCSDPATDGDRLWLFDRREVLVDVCPAHFFAYDRHTYKGAALTMRLGRADVAVPRARTYHHGRRYMGDGSFGGGRGFAECENCGEPIESGDDDVEWFHSCGMARRCDGLEDD